MPNHALSLALFSAFGLAVLPSCQPLSDPRDDRFTTNRPPVIAPPSVRSDGAELFARNPLVEFQATGANPAPIRTLTAGEPLTILQSDGRFTKVSLMDGTMGFINSNEIQQGAPTYTGGYGDNRMPDQYGNRFGGGTRPDNPLPPTGNPNTPPITPTTPVTPATPDTDLIDLDNF